MNPRASRNRRASRGLADLAAACVAFVVLIGVVACEGMGRAPRVQDGVLDLSAWDFERDGIVALEGDWEVCWSSFVPPGTNACPTGADGRWSVVPVPGLWSESRAPSPIGRHGYASYRLRLALPRDAGPLSLRVGAPMTAYRLWIDDQAMGGVGRPGTSKEDTLPRLVNRVYPMPLGASYVEILAHVADFDFRGGGLRRTWYVAPTERMEARDLQEILRYAAFATATSVVGLLFLAQFAFRPSETARGWLGLYALLIGLRVIPAATSDLPQILLGWASFDTQIRLEYLNTSLLVGVAIAYAESRVPGLMPPRTTRLLLLASLALVPIQLFAPLSMVLATISVIAVVALALMLLVLLVYGRAVRDGISAARPTFWAAVVYSIGVSHDIIRVFTGEGARIELFPYFVVVWLVMESIALLRSYARAYARAESLSDELQEANFELKEAEEAIVRFVPFDLLRALDKDSIRDVQGGDHARIRVSVLHCRFHTGPSVEELAGRPSGFAQANDFIGRLDQVVVAHGGFMSGYGGAAIQVFFPNGANDAVAAALEIVDEMRAFDVRSRGSLRSLGEGGIGIDTGSVFVGMLGGRERLLEVLSGEPLEIAPRLSALTRQAESQVLISAATRRELDTTDAFELRRIDLAAIGESQDSIGGDDVYGVVGRRREAAG